MRKLLFLFLFASIFIFSYCDKDPQVEVVGDIDINFKANYDGDLFQTQKVYEYIPGMDIKFTKFDLFVANISLLEEESSTEETELVEIDFIDLSYDITQTTQAEAGVTISTKKVPAGTYKAFKIGFGVPPDLNRTSPNDYGAGDDLNTATHYWAPLDSYIFSKLEGFSDNNGDGVFDNGANEGFIFHLGQDPVYIERILFPGQPIVVAEGERLTLSLNIDVKKLFNMPIDQFDLNSDNLLDLETFDESHGNVESEEFLIDRQLMRNYSDAATLNQ